MTNTKERVILHSGTELLEIKELMLKTFRKYIKLALIITGILATGGAGGAVLLKTDLGLKAVDAVLEQLEPTPTPELR